MGTNTFVAINSVTVSNNTTASIDFTSIPQTYTDLVLVCNVTSYGGNGNYIYAQWGNGSIDTGSNYSTVIASANSSSATSTLFSNRSNFNIDYYATPVTDEPSVRILQIMGYSNTNFYKTAILRASRAGNGADTTVGTWRSTSAINRLRVTTDQNYFASGSTFSLYGIASASVTTAKATGGTIYQDANYFWHVFGTSGTFTPTQNLTNVDYLIIGGGAGGKQKIAGGGGAGGYRTTVGTSGGGASAESKISLGSGVAYTCTVGAGGSGGGGSDSSLSGSGLTTITSLGGGAGGLGGQVSGSTMNGSSGGSGGGGGANETNGTYPAGAGTTGQGFAGATGKSGSSTPQSSHCGGGGGGAGEAAPDSTAYLNRGGNGLMSPIDGQWRGGGGGGGGVYTTPTATTFGVEGRGGGGRGGGYYIAPTNGINGTGGGGGGGGYGGAGEATSQGGSGIIIIRYPKF